MDVDEARRTQLRNIEQSTGTPLADWFALIEGRRAEGLKRGQLVAWLKSEHGLTHGNANALALASAADGEVEPVDLVAAQYAGGKESLRPLYDRLVTLAASLGDDVEVSPKKTSVSLRRSKQFAVLTPATRTRIDVGLNLGDAPADGRLEQTTGMCSHRVRISSVDEVDDELARLLRAAYQRA
ncbi:DUF5655 domain-containing protein [Microbacterium sp. NPDC056044]|uniref:DUF5655 domain-containing protein n=1 Tax=Microbacterium sp. NPDC056044 TaxID=3345690 RepID=UPI0035D7CAF0